MGITAATFSSYAYGETSLGDQSQQTGNNQIITADDITSTTPTPGNGGQVTGTDFVGRLIVIRLGDTDEETRLVSADVAGTGNTRILTVSEDWSSVPVATDSFYVFYNMNDLENVGSYYNTRTGFYELTDPIIIGNGTDPAGLWVSNGELVEIEDSKSGTVYSLEIQSSGRLQVGYLQNNTPVAGAYITGINNSQGETWTIFESGSEGRLYDARFIASLNPLQFNVVESATTDVVADNFSMFQGTDEGLYFDSTWKNGSITGATTATEIIRVNAGTYFENVAIINTDGLQTASGDTTVEAITLRDCTFIGNNDYITLNSNKTWNIINPVWDATTYTDFTWTTSTANYVYDKRSVDVVVQKSDGTKLQNANVIIYEGTTDNLVLELVTDANGVVADAFTYKLHATNSATTTYSNHALRVDNWLYTPFASAQTSTESFDGTITLIVDNNIVQTTQATAITDGTGINWNDETNPSSIISYTGGTGTLIVTDTITGGTSGADGVVTDILSGNSTAGTVHLKTRDAVDFSGTETLTGSGAAGFYYPTQVYFDNNPDSNNTFLSRGADLTGLTDSNEFFIAFSFQLTDSAQDGTARTFGGIFASLRFTCYVNTSNRLIVQAHDSAGNVSVQFGTETPAAYTADGTWHTVMASANVSGSGTVLNRHLYVDGVDEHGWTGASESGNTFEFTAGSTFNLGTQASGFNQTDCYLGPFVWDNSYVDLSSSTNRDNIINAIGAGNYMKDPGNGSNYIGSQALVSFKDAASSYETNYGSGGTFTANGTTLTDVYNNIPSVYFDNNPESNVTQITRGADLTGIADGTGGFLAFGFKLTDSSQDATSRYLFGNTSSETVSVYVDSSNNLQIKLIDTSAGTAVQIPSSGISIVADTWFTVMASWQVNGTDTVTASYLYINGTDYEGTTTGTGVTIDYNAGTDWAIGSRGNDTDFSDVVFSTFVFDDSYLDLSVANNRAKIITQSGSGNYMQDPDDGTQYIGSQALISLVNAASTYPTNTGSGGNFTASGTALSDYTEPGWSATLTSGSQQDFSIYIDANNKSYQATYDYLAALTAQTTLSATGELIHEWGRDAQGRALYKSGADFYTERSNGKGLIIINSGAGNVDYFTDDGGTTWTPPASVTLTITVKDQSGTGIATAQTAIYVTADDTELMNTDTNGSGIATAAYTYTSDTPVYIRVRKSSTGATRYIPGVATGTITASGLNVTVTLREDTIVS